MFVNTLDMKGLIPIYIYKRDEVIRRIAKRTLTTNDRQEICSFQRPKWNMERAADGNPKWSLVACQKNSSIRSIKGEETLRHSGRTALAM